MKTYLMALLSLSILSACQDEAGNSDRSGGRRVDTMTSTNSGFTDPNQYNANPQTGVAGSCDFNSSLTGNLDLKVSLVSVQGSGQLSVQKTSAAANLTLGINITRVFPGLLESKIKGTIANYTRPYTLTLADTDPQFYETHPEWKGLKCLVVAVKKLENSSISISYEPALPMLVVPSADPNVLAALASARVISGITSTVVRSSIPEIRTGTVNRGSATITPSGNGRYVIDNNFGGLIQTSSATPFKKIDMSISGNTYKRLSVDIVIDASTTAPIVFGN